MSLSLFFFLPLGVTIEGVEPPKVLLLSLFWFHSPIQFGSFAWSLYNDVGFFCSFEGIFLTNPSNGVWVFSVSFFVYCPHRDAKLALAYVRSPFALPNNFSQKLTSE